MERVGDRGFRLSAIEAARVIQQQVSVFEQALKSAISDVGNGQDGSRTVIFPSEEATHAFEKLCASTVPPIEVAL